MATEAAKNRIAALTLLTRGQAPSWYQPKAKEFPRSKKKKTTQVSRLPTVVSKKTILCLFVISTCVKVLLFPAYRSTDFLVHRHWKAVTRHLPMSQWYHDDKHVKITHTLDYPPGFALFESFWSNVVAPMVLPDGDDDCLALLDDRKVEKAITLNCVAFMRSTVIASDLVWWYASWCVAQTNWKLFGILVFHPALLWLDHVHFQYNGLLLGTLLLSIHAVHERKEARGAALLGLLVACKHLYVTCSLWYGALWIQRYMRETRNFSRLLQIALAAAIGFGVPVFVVMDTDDPVAWGKHVLSRLFPFQRGLLHDYWAGNVWAFYAALEKVVRNVWHVDLPKVEPTTTVCLMVLMQLPSLYRVSDSTLWSTFSTMAVSTFLFQYHAHEKGILTALFPATIASFVEDGNLDVGSFTAVSLTSLFPLLFRANETAFKLCCWSQSVALMNWCGRPVRWFVAVAMLLAIVQLDLLPTPGRFEFLPLAVTSLLCGSYFLWWWIAHTVALLTHGRCKQKG